MCLNIINLDYCWAIWHIPNTYPYTILKCIINTIQNTLERPPSAFETEEILIAVSVTCIIMKSVKSKQTHFGSWLLFGLCEYSPNSHSPRFSKAWGLCCLLTICPKTSLFPFFLTLIFHLLGHNCERRTNIVNFSICSSEFKDMNL